MFRMEAEVESRAIALYVKDGGRMCEWHAADAQVRHFYRLSAAKDPVDRVVPPAVKFTDGPSDE